MDKPKILLVNPPIYDFTAYDFWLKPYGLLEVAGYLRGKTDLKLFDYLDRARMDHNVCLSDNWGRGKYLSEEISRPAAFAEIRRRYHRFGLKRELFRKFLAGNGPFDFVLVQTVMTYWYQGVKEVIDDIREISPGAKIILGGVYATLCPDHAGSLGPDLIVRGADLAPLGKQLGIEPDLRQPAFWQGYWELTTGTIRLSDGCPFACTYCSVPEVYRNFAPRPLEQCIREYELLVSKGVRDIAFYDDALLFQADKCLVPFLNRITGKRNDVNFHTPNALNARFLTAELACLMVKRGFKSFYIGFESISDKWQERTGGKTGRDELAAAVDNLRAAGARLDDTFAYIIAGHPDSDIQELEHSMEFAHKLGIKVMLSEFSPVPGTPDGGKCAAVTNLDEPLNHNKTAFTIRALGEDNIQRLKLLCKELNGRKA